MKKKLFVLPLFGLLSLFLLGCDKVENNTNKNKPSENITDGNNTSTGKTLKPDDKTDNTNPTDNSTQTNTTTPTIKSYSNVGDLIEEKETIVFNLLKDKSGDVFSASTGKAYNIDNLVFSSIDVNEEATKLTSVNYIFGYKTGEKTRTYVEVMATFSEVSLGDIADGKTTDFELTDVTVSTSINYDAEEKQNDTTFIENLYGGEHDKVVVSYSKEEFGGQTNSSTPTVSTMQELLANYSEEVYDNLNSHYDGVIRQTLRNAYGGTRYEVKEYNWDLGEVVGNKVQNLKLIFKIYDSTSLNTVLRVYDVTLGNALSFSDLLNEETVSATSATYSQAYSFTYSDAEQGTRNALVEAIANVAVTDGFEYDVDDILFKQLLDSTDATLGTVKNLTIVINNENGIREIDITIATASNDQALINKINNGRYNVNYSETANFSQNYININ